MKRLQKTGVPIIYFGTDSATLLPSMKETGAEVIGLDWRIPLDAGWQSLGFQGAVQGNLDPVLLFADWKELESARRRHPAPRRRTPRPHLQSWPRHPSGNSRGQRESALRFRPRAFGGVQAMTPCPLGLGGQCYCANQVSSFAAPPSKTAVLLLAHGSPENPDQIPEFLGYVTGGRPLPPQVIEEIRHRYSLIGFSPLACWTLLQADQLSKTLRLPVFVGMRNWKPFISDAVKAIAAQGFERVIAVCLAPQNSRTSVGLYRRAVSAKSSIPFALDFVDEWHDQPLLVKAFAEKLRVGLGEGLRRERSETAHDFHRAQRPAAHHHRGRSLRERKPKRRPHW